MTGCPPSLSQSAEFPANASHDDDDDDDDVEKKVKEFGFSCQARLAPFCLD